MAVNQQEINRIDNEISNRLGDINLYNALVEIKEAASGIWNPQIRIIRYYTDHGIDHSYRIIDYILKIIDGKNLNDKFTKEEYFILFAAAFLHDIGMQCDLNKHTKIKEKLKTENRITQPFEKNVLEYTKKEVNELRKTHNWAAKYWLEEASMKINCTYDKLKTAVNKVNRINNGLINDIAETCLYHTKMDINSINTNYTYATKTGRKPLAALFRFADELDIAQNRVEDIEEILQIFSIDIESEVYWWFHSRMEINFDANGDANLIFFINEQDSYLIDVIKDKIDEMFIQKNESIIKILNEAFNIRLNIFIEIKTIGIEPIQDKYKDFFLPN